jgi:hypothetical protein
LKSSLTAARSRQKIYASANGCRWIIQQARRLFRRVFCASKLDCVNLPPVWSGPRGVPARKHAMNSASKPPAAARSNAPPPGWGQDELSKFLQETHQQQYATFHRKREATGRLIAIDELFVRVSTGWLNPKSEIAAMLFLRCHAAMRAASGEAMAGQVVESYRQCRGMIENAAYAVHIHRNPRFGEGLAQQTCR